jgi:hypothetical protein
VSAAPPPKVGVWRAIVGLINLPAKRLLWPEGLPALLVGGGGAALVLRACGLSTRVGAMGGLLGLAGGLLAVVFAALALVVSIPSASYMRALSETGRGIQGFLDPFLVAVGIQVLLILLALGYMLAAPGIPRIAEHIAFYLIGCVLVYGLLDIAALARSLIRHGIYRSVLAIKEDGDGDEHSADVHPLRRDSGQ